MFFFTPFSFLFTMLYFVLLTFMFSVSDFYMFWFFMELSTLVFMGISYSIYKNNFSQLLIFFIVQTIAAFLILVFYVMSLKIGFTISFLLKLSMFPFFFWYIDLVSMFPNFLFFFSSTIFKVPSLLILFNFFSLMNMSVILSASIFTLLVGSLMMVFSNDCRFLLLASSVSNNSWFILSQLASLSLFIIYLAFYSLFLFLSLKAIGGLFSSSLLKSSLEDIKLKLIFPLVILSGMPPFPIFFLKMFVVMFLISYYPIGVFLILILVSNVLLLLAYMKMSFSLIMNQQSNQFFVNFSF